MPFILDRFQKGGPGKVQFICTIMRWGSFTFRSDILKLAAKVVVGVGFMIAFLPSAEAGNIRTYSDTISDSAPGEYSNHRFDFTTLIAIPAGGYVRFVPEPGLFTIPASNFDIDNVELYVATSSGYILRSAAGAPSATDDGVSITTGTSGQIEITLNSTIGIPADADVRMVIGTNTTNASGTDTGILNPNATGTANVSVEIGGGESGLATTIVAIIENVTIGVDTTETIPPLRFNGAPTGTLSGTTLAVEMSLETNEFSKCRYSTASGVDYFSMTDEFTTSFVTVHPTEIDVALNTTYTFYVRCIDDEGNFNTDDYTITFNVPEFPEGTPTDDPGDTGGGGSGGGSGGGGGGGGSGSGSGGSGGFEGTDKPYQSGDGRVIIKGYAFPSSAVVILVDGIKADQVTANSSGSFSVTLDEIASGVYTFGVYAVDKNGTKSSTFSTTFTVTGSRGSTLSNVNIMPSILVTPDPVDPGATVTFSGYSIPNATITVENQSDRSSVTLKTFTTTSNAQGAWSVDVSTAGFTTGTYKVRAKAKQDTGISTDYSDFTYYGVGQEADLPQTSDLNRDGFVNLIDFSILLFWWNTDGGASDPPADINRDGRVSLTDFSIMIFNWTG